MSIQAPLTPTIGFPLQIFDLRGKKCIAQVIDRPSARQDYADTWETVIFVTGGKNESNQDLVKVFVSEDEYYKQGQFVNCPKRKKVKSQIIYVDFQKARIYTV